LSFFNGKLKYSITYII